jgi:hypothetical protein
VSDNVEKSFKTGDDDEGTVKQKKNIFSLGTIYLSRNISYTFRLIFGYHQAVHKYEKEIFIVTWGAFVVSLMMAK